MAIMGGLLVLLATSLGFSAETGAGKMEMMSMKTEVDPKSERTDPVENECKRTEEHGKLNTADASPVDPGHFELEFGYSFSQAKNTWDTDGKSRPRGLGEEQAVGLTRSNFPWGVTVGVFKDFDLGLGLDYLWLYDGDNLNPTRGQGISDLSIGARFRFLNLEQYKSEAAYIVGLTIPTGSSNDSGSLGTSQGFWSWNNTLVMTKDWGSWTANVEVGYSLPFGEKRGTAQGTFSANLALGYQILPWLQPEAELNYTRDFVEGDDGGEILAVTGGLVMPFNDRLRVNLGVQQGIWGRNSDQSTNFLLTVKQAF